MNKFSIDSYDKNLDVTSHHIYRDYPTFHTHDYWEFFIVTDGYYRHEINDLTFKVEKDSAFLIRPNDRHALFDEGKKASHLNILFKDKFVIDTCNFISPSLLSKLLAPQVLEVFLSPSQVKSMMDYATSLHYATFEGGENTRMLLSHLLINEIIDSIIKQNSLANEDRPKWLNELIVEIQRPENVSWGVEDVLSRVSYSHAHFAKLFKKYMGTSLISYLTSIKMNVAHDYLLHSDLSILDISIALGYSSMSHFNHVFNDFYHISPSKYRKKKIEAKTNLVSIN